MTENDLTFAIGRLDLRQGDILVVKCSDHVCSEIADRIRRYVANVVPGHTCLILDGGLDLAVLTAADIAKLQVEGDA